MGTKTPQGEKGKQEVKITVMDGLAWDRDEREEPDLDNDRLGAFKTGWALGVASHNNRDDVSDLAERCSYETLADRLTWWNLGYRLGRLFRKTPVELVEEMFRWSTEQYLESKAKRSR